MSVLFRSGSIKSRWNGIVKNTTQHAQTLGKFVLIYKTVIYTLKQIRGSKASMLQEIQSRSHPMDAFWGGLIGGYLVFGTKKGAMSTINQQIVLYVFSRVVMGLGKMALKNLNNLPPSKQTAVSNYSWTLLSSLSWALVMYMFRKDAGVLQKSMLHSMNYLYIDSENWSDITDFF
jgi:peroxisomal membrane protein 4